MNIVTKKEKQILINNFTEKRDAIKKKMAELMEEMKKFMTDNELTEDKFIKNLCDDIYICFRTFDTIYGNMFCTARQTSQGTQRQYTVSNTIDVEREQTVNLNLPRLSRGRHFQQMPRIQRQTNALDDINLDDDIDLLILQHEVSNFNDTPYRTQQATQVMRFVSSSNMNDDDSGEDSNSTLTQEY